jgi:hypothetical protein
LPNNGRQSTINDAVKLISVIDCTSLVNDYANINISLSEIYDIIPRSKRAKSRYDSLINIFKEIDIDLIISN